MSIPSMTPAERDVIDAMLDEAQVLATRPDGSVRSSTAPLHFVTLLRDAEGISPDLIEKYLDYLAGRGAAKIIADRRRRHRIPTATAKGTKVDAPRHAGVKRPNEVGRLEFVQVELPGMTVAELRAHRQQIEAQRNTMSREVRLISDLIDVMEADPKVSTAGEAMARLGRAS